MQVPAQLLAVAGFSAAAIVLICHLPFNWPGVGGNSTGNLPSYMPRLINKFDAVQGGSLQAANPGTDNR